jgi:catechol 2,3-dioxygenase-like lactoylglutathione lyase family enzyme
MVVPFSLVAGDSALAQDDNNLIPRSLNEEEGEMIKGTEHFSFTVSNLNDAVHFFCDLLGLKASPVVEVDNEDIQKILKMPGACLRISIVQTPDDRKIELIEYIKPKGKRIDLETCNSGVGHIAFLVDDIQRMYDDLTKKGIKFNNPPVWVPSNEGKGKWGVCYLKGPDDITLEFVEVLE